MVLSIHKVSCSSPSPLIKALYPWDMYCVFPAYIEQALSDCFWLWQTAANRRPKFPSIPCLLHYTGWVFFVLRHCSIGLNKKQQWYRQYNTNTVVTFAFLKISASSLIHHLYALWKPALQWQDKDRFCKDKDTQEEKCCSDFEKQAICFQVLLASH